MITDMFAKTKPTGLWSNREECLMALLAGGTHTR